MLGTKLRIMTQKSAQSSADSNQPISITTESARESKNIPKGRGVFQAVKSPKERNSILYKADHLCGANLKPDLLKIGVALDQKLMDKLIKLEKIFDFNHIITTIKVAELKTGTGFGELALNNNAPRAATIRANGPCILAYLERTDY